jgi:hypothetical protein
MEDITTELLQKLQNYFNEHFDGSDKVKALYEKVRTGVATYQECNEFSIEAGETLAKTFGQNLSSAVLPDGKMYYNIADRTVVPMLENNYSLVSQYCKEAQDLMNQKANIGIKAIVPKMNQDKIDGIVNRLTSEDQYDTIAWILQEPVVNFSQSIVDDSVSSNAEFQYESGMKPKIIRSVVGHCCEWCANLAGTYSYPDVPKDIYRRHDNCRCTVVYDPGDGKKNRQDVWTKQWGDTSQERIRNYSARQSQLAQQEKVNAQKRIWREESVQEILQKTNMTEKEASIYYNKYSSYIDKYGLDYVIKINETRLK